MLFWFDSINEQSFSGWRKQLRYLWYVSDGHIMICMHPWAREAATTGHRDYLKMASSIEPSNSVTGPSPAGGSLAPGPPIWNRCPPISGLPPSVCKSRIRNVRHRCGAVLLVCYEENPRIYLEKKTENKKDPRHTKCSKRSKPSFKCMLFDHKFYVQHFTCIPITIRL